MEPAERFVWGKLPADQTVPPWRQPAALTCIVDPWCTEYGLTVTLLGPLPLLPPSPPWPDGDPPSGSG
ncbi:hypothetical protein VR46_01710, partial [Streptomyces sp. NRRL S-444]